MHKWMYGNWIAFTERRKESFKNQVIKGFVGNTVMISRRGLEILGPWDVTQQAADFDLFLRTAIRARDVGDIRPMHIALDCFNHHYIRLTLKGGYPPFIDKDKLIPFDKKWSFKDRALIEEV